MKLHQNDISITYRPLAKMQKRFVSCHTMRCECKRCLRGQFKILSKYLAARQDRCVFSSHITFSPLEGHPLGMIPTFSCMQEHTLHHIFFPLDRHFFIIGAPNWALHHVFSPVGVVYTALHPIFQGKCTLWDTHVGAAQRALQNSILFHCKGTYREHLIRHCITVSALESPRFSVII